MQHVCQLQDRQGDDDHGEEDAQPGVVGGVGVELYLDVVEVEQPEVVDEVFQEDLGFGFRD